MAEAVAAGPASPAMSALIDDCYADMRRVARQIVRGESMVSLQATELAHEAAIRLINLQRIEVNGRGHMLALAARVMRQAMIDEVRRARAAKRQAPGSLTDWPGNSAHRVELDVLDDALKALAEVSAQHAEVVEMRFTLGLTIEEAAAATGMNPRTVKRRWQAARVWLQQYLDADGDPDGVDPAGGDTGGAVGRA